MEALSLDSTINHVSEKPNTTPVNDIHRFIVTRAIKKQLSSFIRKNKYPTQIALINAINHAIKINIRRIKQEIHCYIPHIHLDPKDIAKIVFKSEFPESQQYEIIEKDNDIDALDLCNFYAKKGDRRIPICITNIHESAILFILNRIIETYQATNLGDTEKTEHYISKYINDNLDKIALDLSLLLNSCLDLMYLIPDDIIEPLISDN
jgi:hypothetical protein